MNHTEQYVEGREIKVGDEIPAPVRGGRAVIKSLTPYNGPLVDLLGAGTVIAAFIGFNAEMTISGSRSVRVLSRA